MFITDKSLLVQSGIAHGFFGRQGGVSTGIYESLNCGRGSNDDRAATDENRRRVMATLGNASLPLLTVYQYHSNICLTVTEPWHVENPADSPRADAMVTDRSGFALGVLAADCAPVLFAGRKSDGAPVIGAAHSGWRGAVGGVLENTLAAMKDLGAVAEMITAAIGPCIGPVSYEVSADFMNPFVEQDAANEKFFRAAATPDKKYFDLPSYITSRLKRAGVKSVSWTGADTFANEPAYFSYRRTTHRGEPDYGRQVSVISLKL